MGGGAEGAQDYITNCHMGREGREGLKSANKCHVLFEWY
jgi:hypothetical protein